MRALVTGGCGFIGSHLADRLVAEGITVRILDSLQPRVHPRGLPAWVNPRAEVVLGSVTHPPTVRQALEGVDVVFHQAAYQDYTLDFSQYSAVNVTGVALLYETILRDHVPVQKVILASSQAVYGEGQYDCPEHGFTLPQPRSRTQLQRGDWEVQCPVCSRPLEPRLLDEAYPNPFNQYAVSKYAGERLALGLGWLHGIPTVALRYSITQGPRQSLFNHYSGVCRIFVSRLRKGLQPILYEDGRQTRDFVHVSDVVEANWTVLVQEAADFQAFNVGSGVAVSINDYAQRLCQAMQMDFRPIRRGEYRVGDNRHSVSSIEKLQRLGWKPKGTLDDIFADFLNWVDSLGGIPEEAFAAEAAMREAGVVQQAAHS